MAQKNFRAMAQTLIFWGFEPWLKPTFDMQILTSKKLMIKVGSFPPHCTALILTSIFYLK